MPIEDVYIIFTSLAPSPSARVNASGSSITNLTISALSFGDDLYTIIEVAYLNKTLTRDLSISSSNIKLRQLPLIRTE